MVANAPPMRSADGVDTGPPVAPDILY